VRPHQPTTRSRLATPLAVAVVLTAAALVPLAAPAHASGTAPGAPGDTALWTAGDKTGFGTSTTTASKVWYTLGHGELSEIYYPDLGTPAVRDLRFVVTDGKTYAGSDRDDATHVVRLADPHSLSYQQVDTDKAGRWRITKTFTTDTDRSAVQVKVHFESLTRTPLRLYAVLDPSLTNGGDDDSAATTGTALVAHDATSASAMVANPAFSKTSNGFLGTSDGWTDLSHDYQMDWNYSSAPDGNVVQTGRTELSGKAGSQDLTLSLGFGSTAASALSTANASLARGFPATTSAYQKGWHDYLDTIKTPTSVAGHQTLYDVSVMVLAASEDKTFRGAMIAAPSMAWVWGQIAGYSGPYHLVWSRDLYQMATARLAAGDRAGADRSLQWLWNRQQQPDGCFPQNSQVDGTPHWPNLQLDEVADPILLAGQLGEHDATTWSHAQKAASCILANGPVTQERWENETGYSPSSIAAEIAGLVTAADIAAANGDDSAASTYRSTADSWRDSLRTWTVTRDGPLSGDPYFVRLTTDGNAQAGTKYTLSDGGPTVDQRSVVDPSFLELVRLGVLRADDPDVRSTIPVVDRVLGVSTPNGQFWHRYNGDGYGETPTGGGFSEPGNTGRLWPIFAGERGEYELAAGQLSGDTATARRQAMGRLDDMARTANAGEMMPEQVWDTSPPAGSGSYQPGTPTLSSTPLGWSHAQFVRLAWSIDAGGPVERPVAVSCRYGGTCP
jgi:glucoamylase